MILFSLSYSISISSCLFIHHISIVILVCFFIHYHYIILFLSWPNMNIQISVFSSSYNNIIYTHPKKLLLLYLNKHFIVFRQSFNIEFGLFLRTISISTLYSIFMRQEGNQKRLNHIDIPCTPLFAILLFHLQSYFHCIVTFLKYTIC